MERNRIAGEDTVEWIVRMDAISRRAVPLDESATGFVVWLKPGWRRSRSASAQWESSGEATTRTHDCPEPR